MKNLFNFNFIVLLNLFFTVTAQSQQKMKVPKTSGYAAVNGIRMYYETYGEGAIPLVLIHGGGSTIETSFSKIIPLLAANGKIIAVELQAHGRTNDRDSPESFAQDAADVAALLKYLKIEKANFLGFSNGGQTAMQLGISHPEVVNKLIIASAFYKRTAAPDQFWEGMANAKFADMPQLYKDAFLKVNNNKDALLNMFNKDTKRMQTFKDWDDSELKTIKAPALVVNGDQDLASSAHAVAMSQTIPDARLAILPGSHGSYMGEAMFPKTSAQTIQAFVNIMVEFLAQNN